MGVAIALMAICAAQANAKERTYGAMENVSGRCVPLADASDLMIMAEDTRLGIVLFANEKSDVVDMLCDDIGRNASNDGVNLAYTFSTELAEAFSRRVHSAVLLQLHNASFEGISLTTSKGPRLVVGVGTETEPLDKETVLMSIHQMRLLAEYTTLEVCSRSTRSNHK
jgi:hypothetical protein